MLFQCPDGFHLYQDCTKDTTAGMRSGTLVVLIVQLNIFYKTQGRVFMQTSTHADVSLGLL